MVKREFGTAVSPQNITPLDAGWFNTAYAIATTQSQPDLVLRIAPAADVRVLTYEQNLMPREVALHQLVQENGAIPLPKLLGCNFTRDLINHDYMFVEKLQGQPLDKVKDQLTESEWQLLVEQLGSLVAAINQMQGDSFGYAAPGISTNLSADNWPDAYLKMVFALLVDGEALAVTLPAAYADIRRMFEACQDYLPQLERPLLCHFDVWLPNIFVIQQNGEWLIEGITDWERAFWGDPEADTIFANAPFGRPFFTGYGREPNQTETAQIRYALYRLYLWLIMLIEAKVRFEGAAHIPWTREQFSKDWQLLTALTKTN